MLTTRWWCVLCVLLGWGHSADADMPASPLTMTPSSTSSPTQNTNAVLNDLTIVIASCDKYAPLWPTFFACLFRHWPDLRTHNAHVPIILVSEKKTWPDARITCLQTHKDDGWPTAMLTAIEQQVKTRLIVVLHDDYFLCRDVHERRIDEVLSAMRMHPIARCQIGDYAYEAPPYNNLSGARIKDASHRHRFSNQPCLWQTHDFVALMRKAEQVWKVERAATQRSIPYEQATGRVFLFLEGNSPLLHLNAVNQGKMEVCVARWLKVRGLPSQRTPFRHDRSNMCVPGASPTLWPFSTQITA